MTARRIAREIAVILMPQLPKSRAGVEALEMSSLIEKTVRMLADYAKQNLSTPVDCSKRPISSCTILKRNILDNSRATQILNPVTLTTEQLREQIGQLERAQSCRRGARRPGDDASKRHFLAISSPVRHAVIQIEQ